MNEEIKKSYTTYEVAQFGGVSMLCVIKWIDQGKLKCYKTPGGHRRILLNDLVYFLDEYKMPIPEGLRLGTKVRILVVDDDQTIRYAVNRVLEKCSWNIEIDFAVDGFEAGQKISNFNPNLVILDLKLPGMDGFKVCKILRTDERYKNIKILAISGHNTKEHEKKSLAAGADLFLPKPFEPAVLVDKVQALLGARLAV